MSRQAVLSLSIIFALLVHGLFLAAAPHVTFSAMGFSQPGPRPFPVKLRERPVLSQEEPPERGKEPAMRPGTKDLAMRPGSIEDLLQRENENLAPNDLLSSAPADVPQLSERLASELVDREHVLGPAPDTFQKVDAKIIEIAENTARKGIDIPRRLVSPSPTRVLGENEFPVLRAASDLGAEPVQFGAIPRTSLLGQPVTGPPGGGLGAPSTSSAIEKPPYEENVLLPEPSSKGMPALPDERVIARAPVVAAVRKENPYEFMDDLLDIKIDTYVPEGSQKGFFKLQIVPKEGANVVTLPKDVTFVIDASNSIIQYKLNGTAKGAKSMVGMLRPEDHFNIVVFRDSPTKFQPASVTATPENKEAAYRFLSNLESRGQTDVYGAMRSVIETAPRTGIPGVVVFLSDGRPTTGLRDARTIINEVTAENNERNSIFAYGAGNTVDRYLLDLLAYRNKGEARVIPSLDNVDRELAGFFSRLSDPILADPRADYGQIDDTDVFPKEIPDFYKGRAVTVYGRYDPKNMREFSVRLTGMAQAKKKEVIFKADLKNAQKGDAEIARNWAFERIYFLIGEICRAGEKPELLNELRELSRTYNIKTSYSD